MTLDSSRAILALGCKFRLGFLLLVIFSVAITLAFPITVSAKEFPQKPIKVIVTYPPGGGTDVLARIIEPKLAENLGQSVIIENRGGAGGSIGAATAARSNADGYTLLFMSLLPHTAVQGLYASLSYKPIEDFTAVSRVATLPYVIVVNSNVPAKTLGELIEMARSKPGALNFESAGVGSSTHLTGELFKSTFDVNITHIPYRGGGPGLAALLGGEEVQVAFENLAAMMPHIQSGRLRALAVTSKVRSTLLPDVPTVAEFGNIDFDVTGDFGYLVPAGTPKEVVNRLNAAIVETMKSPDMIKKIKDSGAEPTSSTPEEFNAAMRAESKKWLDVIKAIGIEVS